LPGMHPCPESLPFNPYPVSLRPNPYPLTLTPYIGVYCSASGALTISASTVTLDARGNSSSQWIFQTETSLVTATATSFILKNGAQAENVFWVIGSSASIGYSSSFIGTILAQVILPLSSFLF
jgi:hypothetical protein